MFDKFIPGTLFDGFIYHSSDCDETLVGFCVHAREGL